MVCRHCDGCALADVMQEVPLLWEAMSPECRAALGACNKQLRHMLHNCTRLIMLNTTWELSDTAYGRWSKLALIVLRLQRFDASVQLPHRGSLQLLAVLDSSHKQLIERYMVVSNKLQDYQQQAVLNSQCVAWAFSHMHKCMWQPASSLAVRHMQNALAAQMIAQLVTLKLPNLVHLDLEHNKLDAAAIAQLVQGSWPLLKGLNLGETHLDTASAEHLGQSNWPRLQNIRLAHNQLENTAMLHLAKAEWPELVALSLQGNNVDEVGVEWLTQAKWPKLRGLTLDGRAACLPTYTALSLCAASCGSSQHHGNYFMIRASGVQEVPVVVWPSLQQVLFVRGFARQSEHTPR